MADKKQIHLISRWRIKSGCQQQAEEVLKAFASRARKEKGTLTYLIHRPLWDVELVSSPTPSQLDVLFYERYASKAAFNKHLNGLMNFMRKNDYFQYFESLPQTPGNPSQMVEFMELERGFLEK